MSQEAFELLISGRRCFIVNGEIYEFFKELIPEWDVLDQSEIRRLLQVYFKKFYDNNVDIHMGSYESCTHCKEVWETAGCKGCSIVIQILVNVSMSQMNIERARDVMKRMDDEYKKA